LGLVFGPSLALPFGVKQWARSPGAASPGAANPEVTAGREEGIGSSVFPRHDAGPWWFRVNEAG